MHNINQEVKNQIEALVHSAIKSFNYELEYVINIEKPRESAFGDFSINTAMLLSKQLKMPPREVASKFCDQFNFDNTYIEKCEIAGPGFINFYLKSQYLYDALKCAEQMGDDYGRQPKTKGKINMEFVSANPTGPMHMGNARGGALGDALAAVMDFAGYDVTREFYLNDAGAQIEKLEKSLKVRYLQQINGQDSIEFPEDGYQGKDIIEHAKAYISENRTDDIVEYAMAKNIENMKANLDKYKIFYDVWFKESVLHSNGELQNTLELLRKSGYTYEQDGALWFKATDFGLEKDDVLIRNNGIPTYFAVDIAYHYNKLEKRKFDRAINVWGADHHGHIARLKSALQAIGIEPNRLEVITIQLVRLMQDGEVVRMSKRTGEMITLSDLLDDIGVDAARFFFNLRQSDSHFDFDLNLAKEQSNENPVYYVQYAHARICAIINLLKSEGTDVIECKDLDLSVLSTKEEVDLITKIASFPDEIITAATLLEPSRLTRYAMDLSSAFHSFYNACRVKNDDIELMNARLKLIDICRVTLKNTLKLLGVSSPERM